MTGIFFAHPHTLLDHMSKVLEKVGAEKFFTSSDGEQTHITFRAEFIDKLRNKIKEVKR